MLSYGEGFTREMIDHGRELIFIHISRTAGTSIEYACTLNDWWNIEYKTKHLTCSQAHKQYPQYWTDYTTFSVVRNPYDRVMSMFACGVWAKSSGLRATDFGSYLVYFKHFVRYFGPNPNEACGTIFQDEVLDEEIEYILRFERLQRDFSEMFNDLGHDFIKLPHVEAKGHPKWQEFYDKEARQLVYERFERDFDRFKYPNEENSIYYFTS